jgi:hypothetical protein
LNGSSPQYYNGGIQDVIVFNGELSSAEALQVYQNTWQIFKAQPRRLWVVGTSNAIPTLSAATAVNITSTTATPQCVLTF